MESEHCQRCGRVADETERVYQDYQEYVWCYWCLNGKPGVDLQRCWCCGAWTDLDCGGYDKATDTWACPEHLEELKEMQRETEWFEILRRRPP